MRFVAFTPAVKRNVSGIFLRQKPCRGNSCLCHPVSPAVCGAGVFNRYRSLHPPPRHLAGQARGRNNRANSCCRVIMDGARSATACS